VLFFANPREAQKAGFRPCKRCCPDGIVPNPHLDLIEQVCRAIAQQYDNSPTLTQLAMQFNMSPYHLQRTFKRLVGITPKQYADTHRLDRLKTQLKHKEKVTNALYEAGYGSSSSLYEQASLHLGMTPTAYQNEGKAVEITYTVVSCPLGYLLVATTDKGICAVKLGDDANKLRSLLLEEFKQAQIIHNDFVHKNWIELILSYIAGDEAHLDLPLDIRGTAFQKQVWQVLQKIPYGETRTYQEIAREIGQPKAIRAVANACGANPTALIVPCHRVVRSDGGLGGYEWGIERKQKLLENEGFRKGQKTQGKKGNVRRVGNKVGKKDLVGH
jgi:AraC family transcriptional regulator, regulatory protein of adaptative response / methylated-DNA-[protein]-cysteine methyltransferase